MLGDIDKRTRILKRKSRHKRITASANTVNAQMWSSLTLLREQRGIGARTGSGNKQINCGYARPRYGMLLCNQSWLLSKSGSRVKRFGDIQSDCRPFFSCVLQTPIVVPQEPRKVVLEFIPEHRPITESARVTLPLVIHLHTRD
jgi:hypothetical protein